MDFQSYSIAIFLGLVGFSWLSFQTVVLVPRVWLPTSQWFRKNVFWPRVLHDRHLVNPTRAEIALHLAHWTLLIFFNTFKVSSRQQAASRAGYATMAHLFPLVLSGQLSFVSDSFGVSRSVGLKFHSAFGFMAAAQGVLHSTLRLFELTDWKCSIKVGTALGSLVLLLCLPTVRSRAYEVFMITHQVLTIAMCAALWLHVRSLKGLASHLCFGAMFTFLATSAYRYARQLYRNLALRNGLQFVRVQEVRKHNGCLILTLQTSRSWKFDPGQYVHLTVLSLYFASIVQRHPFAITWWDSSQNRMHLMIRAERGWTKSISDRPHLLDSRRVWLDGPYGIPLCLEDYGTVIFFASGDGIFAQLPYLKALTEAYKVSRARTRRIKLVWLTNEYNEQLREWIQPILDDTDLPASLLSMCVHKPSSVESSKVESLGRRVKVIHDLPNVRSHLHLDLVHPETEIAVTVSGHLGLRHRVRDEIRKINKFQIRLFELDYQPNDEDQYDGGITV